MKNNQANTLKSLNPIVANVLDILHMKQEAFTPTHEWMKTDIQKILKQWDNAKNKELALYLVGQVDVWFFHKISADLRKDKDIVIAAIQKDSGIYVHLEPQSREQIAFWKEAIRSLVRERANFLVVEKFLKKHFTDTKKFRKLFSFYKKYLKKVEYIFDSDIERHLFSLKEKQPDLFDLFSEKQVFEEKGKKFVLSKKIILFFQSQISWNSEYAALDKEEQDSFLLEVFKKYLGIASGKLPSDVIAFFQSIRELIGVKEAKQQIEKQIVDQDDLDEEEDDDNEITDEDSLDSRLDLIAPYCVCNIASWGGYNISVWNGVELHLSHTETERITNMALKNYIATAKVFQNLWLGFLLPYKEKLFSICDVEYLHGEWLSKWKLLKIFNTIGKNIGIPEKNIQNDDDNAKKQVGCFITTDEAIYQMKVIRDTGKVYNRLVIDPGDKGGKSVLRHLFENKWLFDAKWDGILRSVWK